MDVLQMWLEEIQMTDTKPTMPVEPECVTRMRRLKDDPTWDVEWTTLRYIDTLQAVIKRKDAEEMKMAMLVNIADEKRLDAERERDALRKDAERYRFIRKKALFDWDAVVLPKDFAYSEHAENAGLPEMTDEAIEAAMDEGSGK
jgi:hypothetical protein